jgi:hypothetical protein
VDQLLQTWGQRLPKDVGIHSAEVSADPILCLNPDVIPEAFATPRMWNSDDQANGPVFLYIIGHKTFPAKSLSLRSAAVNGSGSSAFRNYRRFSNLC